MFPAAPAWPVCSLPPHTDATPLPPLQKNRNILYTDLLILGFLITLFRNLVM
jgi:hypothetical protein